MSTHLILAFMYLMQENMEVKDGSMLVLKQKKKSQRAGFTRRKLKTKYEGYVM